MSARAVLAFGLSLVLFLAGCAERANAPRPEAAPASTGSAKPMPTPTPPATPKPTTSPKPKPKPTRTAPPRLRPLPTTLPAGLRRTTGSHAVALTFDDGPDPVWTPKILDQLKAAKAQATFCVIGTRARRYPQLVARIVREGHQLCNHSWQHDLNLGRRPVGEIKADLVRTNRAIQAAVPGAKVPFYRQPGGRWTPEVVAVARQLGMRPLHWAVDPQDWAKPTAPTIRQRVVKATRPGSIVLLHDGGGDRAATVAACANLIGELKRRYGLVRLR
ncbi:polysaccharide deacetylase family protein [Micromonospora olivasterospora]|uniref:Peptidoglycan/xylan/chitin deacetylase (PgdA/CDA1 family) n=1 Tax=Micromonospora olivasterospora TaxID=1880 RepID=A0A562IAH9_MICOL|nr:polysaccharide deacetylase family protein [Micromonospora olivasterospora]TWH67693.1 peptidoglycan/xylan/chitin deacetylase (PgdA/CDA1 family) [Micromonospora olivasterospora]